MRSIYRVLAVGTAAAAALTAGSLGSHPALAAGTTRYVATNGTDNATCDQAHPCQHVQHAVDVATPGDTIRVKAGTYVEQVTITKSVNIVGDGVDATNIKAPAVMVPEPTYQVTYVVEIKGAAATVGMTQLTVRGPGVGAHCTGFGPPADPTAIDNGVMAVDKSTLNMFNAAVRDIINQVSLQGCQTGDAISVGKPGGVDPSLAQPAHATLVDVQVTNYQKDGVAGRSAGTTLNLYASTIADTPSPYIASNGVEVLDGALGDIRYNSVSGNECNLAGICGPDPINNTEASGILTFAANTSTVIARNNVFANDMGIYTDDNIRILDNADSNNRATGLYVDTDATNLRTLRNTFNKDGYYGVTIGPAFPPPGGTGAPNQGGNTFANNTAFGNTQYDLYQSPGSGNNHNDDNHCGTAFPSRTYWDCEGSESGGGDGDRDDSGSDGGDGGGHHGDTGGNHPESRDD